MYLPFQRVGRRTSNFDPYAWAVAEGPAIPVRARSSPCIWQCSGKVAVAGFSCARVMVVPPSDPVGLIGKLTSAASDTHVTAGFVALSITSRATGSLEFFDSNNLKVFDPTSRPDTTPTPSCDSQLVTLSPFSVSLVWRIASLEGPVTLIDTEFVVTNPIVGVSGVVIV